MSTEAMELVLHDLGVKREARSAFAENAAAMLSRYALQESEALMIRDFDVAGLQARGVSPLLTYGFWLMNGPTRTRAAYLERLRQGS